MSGLTPSQFDPDQIPDQGIQLEVGNWYWITRDDDDYKKKYGPFFGCIVKVGSNFVEFQNPYDSTLRIHFDEFMKRCKREMDPEAVIIGRQNLYRDEVRNKLTEIRQVTARLGLDPSKFGPSAPQAETRSLSVLSAMPDMKKYKRELIHAKDKQLPKLFEEVKESNRNLTVWMKAQSIPMEAMADGMKEHVARIDDRIFNVSLYAGLTEDVEQISDGQAAPATEKLHLFQRLAYMDEECLVNYRHGGMEFKHIRQFDRWIAEPENLNRLLPFPRSMVAFRVRRNTKERDWDGTLSCMYINISLEKADKLTFMYIRNGEKLYRMDCDQEFRDHIFPRRDELDLSEPMMAKVEFNEVRDIITKREYDSRLREKQKKKELHDQWQKEHPKEDSFRNPFHNWDYYFNEDRWEPFDKTSVYYDEMQEEVATRIKYYNRIAMILQGLFDRSEILHPHPPAKLWVPGGMEALVELMYDGADSIHYKEPPDFEEYRKRCNESLKEGSTTIGQEDFWERWEAKKENDRRSRSWRSTGDHRVTKFQPYGNPGPGFIAKISEWYPRKSAARFRWERKFQGWNSWKKNHGDPVPCSIAVPADKLFNVDAYKPGDFKQFYQDPRTRAKYLQWAPLLLAAEEWHAGNVDETDGKLKKKAKKR